MIHAMRNFSPTLPKTPLRLLQPVQRTLLVRALRRTCVGQSLLGLLVETRLRHRMVWVCLAVGGLILTALHSWATFTAILSIIAFVFVMTAITKEWNKMMRGTR